MKLDLLLQLLSFLGLGNEDTGSDKKQTLSSHIVYLYFIYIIQLSSCSGYSGGCTVHYMDDIDWISNTHTTHVNLFLQHD